MRTRRVAGAVVMILALVAGSLATAVPATAAPATVVTATVVTDTAVTATAAHPSPTSSAVVRDWERISIGTIYTDNPTPIPVGVLYLGFTSLAMYRAAQAARWQHGSAPAAVAVAAHGVLAEYFPASATELSSALTKSLAAVPTGRAKQRGIEIGARVAHRLIVNRADDGRNDTSIVYDRPKAPGVWQPPDLAPPGGMLAPWLGFVRPLVVHRPIRVGGPDPLTSAKYAAQYKEVKKYGAAAGSARTQAQTDTALFFNDNSAVMVGEALLDYLDAHPMSLLATARLFAVMHTSMTDAVITCWRLKYQVGFWRPFQAIHDADEDGNPATSPDPTWASLLNTPPYSDYVSGHGSLTSPAVQTIRRTLGENTVLTLRNTDLNVNRTYPNLRDLEKDAFHSRIWGGLHFRTAMEDAYYIGHQTANQVLRRLH